MSVFVCLSFLVCALILPAVSISGAVELPARPTGPVADYASVIDGPTQEKLTSLAEALWQQAQFGLVVATIPTLNGQSIDEYAPALYKTWGIGDKTTDEGVLLLLSLDPRRVRIEVGFGSEGYLNDSKTGRILDEYGVPSFKTGDYSTGLLNVASAIAGIVAAEKKITLSAPVHMAPAEAAQSVKLSPFKIILILILLGLLLGTPFGRTLLWFMIMSNLLGGGRRGGGFGGGFGGGGFGGGFGGGMSGGGGSSRGF